MMLFKGSFPKKPSTSHDEAEDRVLAYLGALVLNGQINDDYQYGWQGDELVVVVHMPKASSVSPRNNSVYVKNASAQMSRLLLKKPQWEHLATDREGTCGSYLHAPYLYLFTTALSTNPPVCSGHNGNPIPTYQIPIEFAHREALYRWRVQYADYDGMWLNSGALEKAAYRELTSLDSDLTSEGRELCSHIEGATNKPTYYYLMHYYRNKKREAACPGCGSQWRKSPNRNEQPFWQFDFKCDDCRLASHYASE